MPDPELMELRKQHQAGQDKYTYFLLAAAGAAIAFAVNRTDGLPLNWRLLPVAAAALCWASSFFFGCRALYWTQACASANYNLLSLQSGVHPEQPQRPEEVAAASSGVRKALVVNMRSAEFFTTWQFRSLIAGAVLFIAWHAAGLRSGIGIAANFDDCILQYVKSGMDSSAVASVTRSCRAKFPAPAPGVDVARRQLTSEELAAVTGRAGLSYGDRYAGNIYNGNAGMILTEVAINVATTISGREVARAYRSDVWIPTNTTGSFSFDIIAGDKDAQYTWSMSSARGKPTQ